LLESKLAENIDPIRNMFLAQAILVLFDTELFELLKQNSSKNIKLLAEEVNVSSFRLEGLILYLKNEGLIDLDEHEIPHLTQRGLDLESAKPWYQLLVGGYGKTLFDLPALLNDRSKYGSRVGEYVGRGSCGISQFDALPMTRELILGIGFEPHCIVDIGCGDGSYLIDLCKSFPNTQAVGIEPDESSVLIARDLIARNQLKNQATVKNGSLETIADLKDIPNKTVFVIAFALQEALEQSGQENILEILRQLKNRHPLGKVVVIEVDRADRDTSKMTSALGLGYYNPYFLIHRLTEQRLEPPTFWEETFSSAGWKVKRKVYPEPSYDSLQLKIGYLLS